MLKQSLTMSAENNLAFAIFGFLEAMNQRGQLFNYSFMQRQLRLFQKQ